MSSKTQEFSQTLQSAAEIVQLNCLYRHYKGGIYRVNGFSIDTDTLEARVEYYRISGPEYCPLGEQDIIFSRPLNQWYELIEVEGLGAPLTVRRFTRVKQVQVTQYREVE